MGGLNKVWMDLRSRGFICFHCCKSKPDLEASIRAVTGANRFQCTIDMADGDLNQKSSLLDQEIFSKMELGIVYENLSRVIIQCHYQNSSVRH